MRRDEVGAWGVRIAALALVLWSVLQAAAIPATGGLRPQALPVVGVVVMAMGFAAWAAWRAQPIGYWIARVLWPERVGAPARVFALVFGSAALACLGRGAFDLAAMPTALLSLDAVARGSGFVPDTAWIRPAVVLDGACLLAGVALLWIAAWFGRRVA